MSDMIDGYTAQKIKDFWMAQPDMRVTLKDINILYKEITELRKEKENK